MILSILFILIFIIFSIECRSVLLSHINPSDVKYFESELDEKIGFWSPSTSSIDWCERNYVITKYIAEFFNCISSIVMCILAGLLFVRGLYYKIEKRFLFLDFSFGLVGFGSAYFHGTLTYFGQMLDELPMVYTMIIWYFILFRINQYNKLNNQRFPFDILIIFGILYTLLWTYIHTLKTFVLVFQIHFTLMVFGGIIKLIFLYKKTLYKTNYIMYFILIYVVLLFPATICWIIDQKLCQWMNSKNGFNPQFHAWWHIICAFDFHVGVVCVESMRLLTIKYQEYQLKYPQASEQSFKPEDHLHIVFYFGLPFVDYSKDKPINQIKNQ